MRARTRRRFAALLRLCAFMVLAVSLLLRPVLSSIGEMHELAHDPSGQHLDIEHAAGATTHDAARERGEGKSADTLHALLHFAHCCGQVSAVNPDGVAHTPAVLPYTPLLNPDAARPPTARWTTPFRPPIAS